MLIALALGCIALCAALCDASAVNLRKTLKAKSDLSWTLNTSQPLACMNGTILSRVFMPTSMHQQYDPERWAHTESVLRKDGLSLSSILDSNRQYGTLHDSGPESFPVPESYDWRRVYSHCNQPVVDQKLCASSWAIAAASVFGMRQCSQRTEQADAFSAQWIISCNLRADGCQGGKLSHAWDFLKKTGIAKESCIPYSLQSSNAGFRGMCQAACVSNAKFELYKVSSYVEVSSGREDDFMKALVRYGPLTTNIFVYEDFLLYSGGIYRHVAGDIVGSHAVVITGYGAEEVVDFATGVSTLTKFWICKNSFGPAWGESGFFRIVRGENECGIEDFGFAAIV